MKISNENENRLLAFDYGSRKIGVAFGNLLIREAHPITIIKYYNTKQLFSKVSDIITQWEPDLLIVGLPLYSNGTYSSFTKKTKYFGSKLYNYFNLPIIWVDERFSSVEAKNQININNIYYKRNIDAQSACIILKQYFNENFF